jgi:acetyltransferase-like isoleucine patch superfamily enzyme
MRGNIFVTSQTIRGKAKRFFRGSFYDKLNTFTRLFYRFKAACFYRFVFASFGKRIMIEKVVLISNPRFIHIGNNVSIRKGVRLEAIVLDQNSPPEIRIGDNVGIEQNVHIVCMGKIIIHENVSIAAGSSLLCGTHPFFDVDSPVKIGDRLSGVNSIIEIGAGTLIGVGCVIQMNVRIGCHVVVGANSVVKRSVPDYSVVDGNPAAVVMRYDKQEKRWAPVKKA